MAALIEGTTTTCFCKHGNRGSAVSVLQAQFNEIGADWVHGDAAGTAVVREGIARGNKTGKTHGRGE